jgi:hypothetical protein
MEKQLDTSRINKLPPKNTLRYKKLLQSGSLGTLVAGKAVKILDTKNLKEGNFVRCEVIEKSKGASYIGDLRFIDIPEISLLRYIATQGKEKPFRTRMIVSNGATIGSYDTMSIESYESETHELTASCTVGGWKVRLKVPVTFSSYEGIDLYKWAKESLKWNPTQPASKPFPIVD